MRIFKLAKITGLIFIFLAFDTALASDFKSPTEIKNLETYDLEFVREISSASCMSNAVKIYKDNRGYFLEEVGALVVVKSLKLLDKIHKQLFQNELSILNGLKDFNGSVKLLATLRDDKLYYLVLEYAKDGDLFDRIKARESLGKRGMLEDQAKLIFEKIGGAVRGLHHLGVAHLDIKPENILFDGDDIKICDFCASVYRKIEPNQQPATFSSIYTAPEVIKGEVYYPTKADVYSLGVTLFVMLTGIVPNNLPKGYFQAKGSREALLAIRKSWQLKLSDEVLDLIAKMMEKEPEKRPKMSKLLKHPFVTSGKITRQLAKNWGRPYRHIEVAPLFTALFYDDDHSAVDKVLLYNFGSETLNLHEILVDPQFCTGKELDLDPEGDLAYSLSEITTDSEKLKVCMAKLSSCCH